MTSKEVFTTQEIIEILEEIGLNGEYKSAAEGGTELGIISCESALVPFWIILLFNEPFCEGFKLFSVRHDVYKPFVFANDFNDSTHVARVSVDESDEALTRLSEENFGTIYALSDIRFAGGVTREHLKFLLQMWNEDLADFAEIFRGDNKAEFISIPELANLPQTTLQVQITACLGDGRTMTSREIGQVLDIDRQVINSILYKEKNRFIHDANQPPRWTLKR